MQKIKITTKIGCSNRCIYCPQDAVINAYGKGKVYMSLEDFKYFLGRMKKGTTIEFAGMSEPFLNPDCINMIEYTYAKGYGIYIVTTLVGLTSKIIKRLEKVDINLFSIHLASTKDENIIKSKDYHKLLQLVLEGNIKNKKYIYHEALHESLRYLNSTGIKMTNGKLISRAGNVDGIEYVVKYGPVYCVKKVDKPVLLPNGDLVVCCTDYKLDNIIGNLKSQSLDEIYSGKKYLRFMNAMKKNKGSLCHKCEFSKIIKK